MKVKIGKIAIPIDLIKEWWGEEIFDRGFGILRENGIEGEDMTEVEVVGATFDRIRDTLVFDLDVRYDNE